MADAPEKKLTAHLFICTNKKANKECCADKGGMELRDRMKSLAKKRWPDADIRVNAAGCLGPCEDGINAVLYPEGRWMSRLTSDSLPELEKALEEALKKAMKLNLLS